MEGQEEDSAILSLPPQAEFPRLWWKVHRLNVVKHARRLPLLRKTQKVTAAITMTPTVEQKG